MVFKRQEHTPSEPHTFCEPGCCDGVDRRRFIQLSGAGLAALATLGPAMAGPFKKSDTVDHFVPADKKLRPAWTKALFARGSRAWYQNTDLKTIGMPVGGIAAGQVYLTGDGRLVYWGIYNRNINTGFGQVNYKVGRLPTEMVVGVRNFVPTPDVDQGFAVRVTSRGKTTVRTLDEKGFPETQFCGEYPIGYVDYRAKGFPLRVQLEAFSPFIPLNAEDSALPATLLNYTLKNESGETLEVTLAGWLQNKVLHYNEKQFDGVAVRTNRLVKGDGMTAVLSSVKRTKPHPKSIRPPVVLADFEGKNYGDWTVSGEAFGSGPAQGTLAGQQRVSGFQGHGLVNSFLGGNDRKTGKLTSPEFTIERPFISFLIGGGPHKQTAIHLVVDGRRVHSGSGKQNEQLKPTNWNVRDLIGKKAHIEIVDEVTARWGHINIDQIEMRDVPRIDGITELALQEDFGTMGLAILGGLDPLASVSLPGGDLPDKLFDTTRPNAVELASDGVAEKPLDQSFRGALGQTWKIQPGAEVQVTFVVTWHMPNMYFQGAKVGNRYAKRFKDAAAVARHVAENADGLSNQTRLWHDTYYDSTLPHWLLDRLHSTLANLATTTCQWWENGRFWAYEGCGCCRGTCGHVWNYEHGMARLFPRLERSVREMQDFAAGIGFIPETGEIRFRGEGWGIWAGDSQGGYILKAYREHQVSRDDAFLKRNWPNIRQAVEFLIKEDGNADGLLEGRQHQTYDQNYYGPNTMVGSLYLGALRAAEEMARDVGDAKFADLCRRIFEAGSRNSVAQLFNGEYYIQKVDLEKHSDWQYGDGCLADQMFGQGWAHQVNLGYLYPKETVLKSIASIWKYCWAPDIGPQDEHHKPERWFAYPGEAGLLTCTWPKSKHMGPKSTRYRDEIWTGIEYQVANHMAYEGMLTECLAICRGIHDRYHPSKHNPFNEIECGDHYARALASWGVLLSLVGFEYHGPKRHLGFAPRLTPEQFRAVFTAAEGWGTYDQRIRAGSQTHAIEVKWGTLRVQSLSLALAKAGRPKSVTVNGQTMNLDRVVSQEDTRLILTLPGEKKIGAGERLTIEITT